MRGSDAVHEHGAQVRPLDARQSWCLDGWGLAAERRWLSDACCSSLEAAATLPSIINFTAPCHGLLNCLQQSLFRLFILFDLHVPFVSAATSVLLCYLLAEHVVQHSLNGVTRSRTGVIGRNRVPDMLVLSRFQT